MFWRDADELFVVAATDKCSVFVQKHYQYANQLRGICNMNQQGFVQAKVTGYGSYPSTVFITMNNFQKEDFL